MALRGTLLGGTDLRYTDVAFSRDGARVAAFGNRTDYLATVWNLKKESPDGEELTGEKVRASLPFVVDVFRADGLAECFHCPKNIHWALFSFQTRPNDCNEQDFQTKMST